jgi:hypothetical protein
MDEYCLYLRKSRIDLEAEANGQGDTLARHRAALLKLAQKRGFNITGCYEEVRSGESIAARPEMQRLLNDVEDGRWAGVLVMEVERLARGNTTDQGIVADTFKYSDTKIVTPNKIYDPGDEFDEEYFEHLLDEIREIRASERKFYQKITDIYATAVDYSKDAVTTKEFFKTVQNKLHYAIHGHTAAEVIVERADHEKEHMGLTTWKNAPGGKIVKSDVSIAKNYLSQSELQDLNQFVSMYLDYAERQAKKRIPMTMEDWASKLEVFLKMNDEDILMDKGKVTHEIAKAFAESEFEKYRVIQDQLYESDFDKLVMKVDLL